MSFFYITKTAIATLVGKGFISTINEKVQLENEAKEKVQLEENNNEQRIIMQD